MKGHPRLLKSACTFNTTIAMCVLYNGASPGHLPGGAYQQGAAGQQRISQKPYLPTPDATRMPGSNAASALTANDLTARPAFKSLTVEPDTHSDLPSAGWNSTSWIQICLGDVTIVLLLCLSW